jgi:KUP system potassium uptake protein
VALGSVVLTITGAEALYADMGHFGRSPIRRAWFLLVFPALILNYMGQGALLLRDPSAVENPFFLMAPEWSRIPMVLLATMATVIASQAVISGAFSVTRQAVRLGFLPRLTIRHTSEQEIGQVYVPAVNWLIFAAVIALVLGFRSSAHLASAYGVAVTGTLAIDTLLFFYVVRNLWHKPLWLSVIGCLSFLLVDLTFFTANLTKIFHGGWFPLTIALAVYVVLTTWQRGREIVTRNRIEEEGALRAFVEELRELRPSRAPGTGVFLNSNPETTPLAMRAAVEHLHALPESVVIISLQVTNQPHVPIEQRLEIDDLGYRDDGILHITSRHGFQDETHVPKLVQAAARRQLECDITLDNLSYFVSRITIVVSDSPDMARWRKKLFLGIARNAGNPVEYFALPEEQTVVFGSLIAL